MKWVCAGLLLQLLSKASMLAVNKSMLVLLTCYGLQGRQEQSLQMSVDTCIHGCQLSLQSQQIISMAVLMHYIDCKQDCAQCLMCKEASEGSSRGSKGTPPGRKTQSKDALMKLHLFLCTGVHTCSFAVKTTLQPL